MLDRVFRLAAIEGSASDARDDAVVTAGPFAPHDGTCEARADDALKSPRLADPDLPFRMHGRKPRRNAGPRRRAVDLRIRKNTDVLRRFIRKAVLAVGQD